MEITEYEYHKQLNPQLWDKGDVLNKEVNYALLKIAMEFIDFLKVNNFELYDVVLVGSMANYNWTEYSDIDVHILSDFTDIDFDLAENLYRTKKELWKLQHDIKIHGYDVELYVEDINDPGISKGVYSLLKSKWIKKPDYEPPTVSDSAVTAKVKELENIIDHLLDENNSEKINKFWDELKTLRSSGLEENGEFSIENLTYKELRNNGYISRLADVKNNIADKKLSI